MNKIGLLAWETLNWAMRSYLLLFAGIYPSLQIIGGKMSTTTFILIEIGNLLLLTAVQYLLHVFAPEHKKGNGSILLSGDTAVLATIVLTSYGWAMLGSSPKIALILLTPAILFWIVYLVIIFQINKRIEGWRINVSILRWIAFFPTVILVIQSNIGTYLICTGVSWLMLHYATINHEPSQKWLGGLITKSHGGEWVRWNASFVLSLATSRAISAAWPIENSAAIAFICLGIFILGSKSERVGLTLGYLTSIASGMTIAWVNNQDLGVIAFPMILISLGWWLYLTYPKK